MANFNWKIISWKKGTAAPHSDYIWRRNQFSACDDLVATGCGNLPPWCGGDPAVLFRASDLYERHNGSACRELIVSLPRELGRAEWIGLVETLIQEDIGPKPYQYGIHVPREQLPGDSHPHAHILYSDRIPDEHERAPEMLFRRFNPTAPEVGGCRKDSGGQTPKQLRLAVLERKGLWAKVQNEALAAGGHTSRVDHRPPRKPRRATNDGASKRTSTYGKQGPSRALLCALGQRQIPVDHDAKGTLTI